MSNEINTFYEFGRFRFDVENQTLWFEERLIPLPPKATDVLLLLLEAEGKIVSKNEILNSVWADTFVEEGVLTQSIYQLRQALGAEDEETLYIENIARRGYRIAVAVKKASASENPALTADRKPENFSEVFYQEESADLKEEINPVNFYTSDSKNGLDTQTEIEEKPTTEQNSSNKHFLYLAAFALLIFSIAGFLVFRFSGKETVEKQTEIAPIEQLKFQRLTDFGNVVFPTISPNGELLAFIRHEEDGETLWIKQLETEGLLQLFPPSKSGFRSPVFSPDGKYVFFREDTSGGGIFQVSILGGTPKKVADNVWSDFSLSKDGRQFAFYRKDLQRDSYLLILSALDGNVESELSSRKIPKEYRGSPSWSPDGTKLAVIGGLQRQLFPGISTIDTRTGEETELKIPQWRAISNTLWMMNGKYLIVSARDINAPNPQIWILDIESGEVRRLTNDLESYFWISLSADGSRLVARQQRIVLHIWMIPDGDLEKAVQLTSGERRFDGYGGLTWTPDGKIIFSVRNDNITDLYSMNRDGSDQIRLTENSGQDNIEPVASGDGKYIVFTSSRNGSQQIWRMDTDGQNLKQLTYSESENAYSRTISPDRKVVYFIKTGSDRASICKISIEGGKSEQILEQIKISVENFLTISPDGKRVIYRQTSDKVENSGDEATIKIGIVSLDESEEPISFELPMRRNLVEWSGNESLDYFAGTFNTSSLMRLDIKDGKSRKLMEFSDRINNFAWSKNGKDLAVSRGSLQGDAILITNLPK